MEVGLYIRDFLEDADRPMHQQVEEAAEVCRRAKSLGFRSFTCPSTIYPIPPCGCSQCKRWPGWLPMPRA